LSETDFRDLFRGSPIKRTKWRGFVRNACIAVGNSAISRRSASHVRVCDSLKRLVACEDSIVAESAQWALSRIQ
jgi:epoxyqueuosine reductase